MWIRTKNGMFNLNNCETIEVRENENMYDLVISSINGKKIFLKQSDNEADIRKIIDTIWDCIKNGIEFACIENL